MDKIKTDIIKERDSSMILLPDYESELSYRRKKQNSL